MDYAPEVWHDFAVTVAGLAGLVGGVINAWLFLLRVPSTTEAPGQVSDSPRTDDSETT